MKALVPACETCYNRNDGRYKSSFVCVVMRMKIEDYFTNDHQEHWLSEIERCDWRAGQFLHQLLRERRFHALLGEKSRLLLLTEGDHLIAFCTYAQRDEIPADELTP